MKVFLHANLSGDPGTVVVRGVQVACNDDFLDHPLTTAV
jgi:hypothetical protein